jgi:hypothetical protein
MKYTVCLLAGVQTLLAVGFHRFNQSIQENSRMVL